MSPTVRRAGAFAAIGVLALVAPLYELAAPAPFLIVAVVAALIRDGPLFDLFARPGDRRDERLKGLIGFAVAAAVLGVLTAFGSLPVAVFVSAIVLYAFGNFAAEIARSYSGGDIACAAGFVVGGLPAGVAAHEAAILLADLPVRPIAEVVVLATSGALLGALLRSILLGRDDPPVVLSIGLLLWLLADLSITASTFDVGVALGVTAALGYVSYALETASVEGMLAGVFLAFLAIVLGGYGWFAAMIAFFAIGGLSTKFRYEEKEEHGMAEENDGARGSANVLGNATVALVAVLAHAAAGAELLAADPALFLFVFTGSLATALSDTLSSEVGGVYDNPRLITTLERVDPGTDGGVTWQGEVAGVVGAGVMAVLSNWLFADVGATGALVIVGAGIGGMTVDSLLGATVEGEWLGNQSVNFLATLSGGLIAGALAIALALVGLS